MPEEYDSLGSQRLDFNRRQFAAKLAVLYEAEKETRQ
jgi:hypothetical protein